MASAYGSCCAIPRIELDIFLPGRTGSLRFIVHPAELRVAQQDPDALAVVKATVREVFLTVRCHNLSLSCVRKFSEPPRDLVPAEKYKNQYRLVRVRAP